MAGLSFPEASFSASAAATSPLMSPLKDFRAVRASCPNSPPSWLIRVLAAAAPPIFPAAAMAAFATSPPSPTAELTSPDTEDILLLPNQLSTSTFASGINFLNFAVKSGTRAEVPTILVALLMTEFLNILLSLLRAEATVFQTFAGLAFMMASAARHCSWVLPDFSRALASLRERPGSGSGATKSPRSLWSDVSKALLVGSAHTAAASLRPFSTSAFLAEWAGSLT